MHSRTSGSPPSIAGIVEVLPEGAHTRRRGQKVTKSRTNKKQLAELLGMSPSAAERKLRKAIIYELALQLRKNICLECDLEISDPNDLAVVHVEDWEDGPSYFDLANVAFSHASCRAERHDRRQGEREMQRVTITVEDSRGRPLRGCTHNNQLYVAGDKDQRYQVRIKNRTNQRLCLVVTVDGRNVNNGEKGSWDGSGFVLEAYQEWTFKGWRQSNDNVAAFRLGAKEDGYSSQKGTPQNTGVIGVAVFEEEQPEPRIITVKETQYVPVPYPVPTPQQPQWGGSGIRYTSHTSTGGYVPTSTTVLSSSTMGSSEVSCSVASVSAPAGGGVSSANLSMDSFEIERGGVTRGAKRKSSARRRRAASPKGHEQELGTEYGETLKSKVQDTTFERSSDEPCELHLIKYDSISALKKAGIMTERPSARPKPQAFPESPEVEQGFCTPPRRRRF